MARPMEKRSVTLDPDVAAAVDRLVADGKADSFSAAMNTAADSWAANQALRVGLDEMYAEDPDSRPTELEIAAAGKKIQRAIDRARASERAARDQESS